MITDWLELYDVPEIVCQSPADNTLIADEFAWNTCKLGSVINNAGDCVLSTQLSTLGVNDIVPCSVTKAKGFTLTVLEANCCTIAFAVVNGNEK